MPGEIAEKLINELDIYAYPTIEDGWTLNQVGRKPFYKVSGIYGNKIEIINDEGYPKRYLMSKFNLFKFKLEK